MADKSRRQGESLEQNQPFRSGSQERSSESGMGQLNQEERSNVSYQPGNLNRGSDRSQQQENTGDIERNQEESINR